MGDVKRKAKENGTGAQGIWLYVGLDSNNHLFKAIDAEAKRKIELFNKNNNCDTIIMITLKVS